MRFTVGDSIDLLDYTNIMVTDIFDNHYELMDCSGCRKRFSVFDVDIVSKLHAENSISNRNNLDFNDFGGFKND